MKNFKLNHRLLFGSVLLIFFFMCGCVAPMARTSYIKTKDYAEIGAGPLLFKSVAEVEDSTSAWGHDLEDAIYLGFQGNLRLGFGFNPHFGVDLTLSVLAGDPILGPGANGEFAYWMHGAVFFKVLPGKSNYSYLLGLENPGILTMGWVHGFPSYENEKYSMMIELANQLPLAIANEWTGDDLNDALLPSVLEFSISRNYYFQDKRLSPNLAIGAIWDWDTHAFQAGSLMLGVNYTP